MSKIVNLNHARKAKMRAAKKRRADVNSVKFGRSKAKTRQVQEVNDRLQSHIAQHKLDKNNDLDT